MKANGAAAYESSLERDLLTILEFNLEIDGFTVQPITLEWKDGTGKLRQYTPDVYFSHVPSSPHGAWLCEVKYRDDLRENWEQLRPKFKAGIRFARAQGWRFRILTEVEIRTPYLENARFLLNYRRSTPDLALVDRLCDQLEDMREATPAGLIEAVFRDKWKQAQALTVLWHLIGARDICTDLNAPLTMSSSIWAKP